MPDLIHLPEPRLLFGYNQSLEDPRDGLTLLGPHDPAQNYGVKYGVVATKEVGRNWSTVVHEMTMNRGLPPHMGSFMELGGRIPPLLGKEHPHPVGWPVTLKFADAVGEMRRCA